jgi:uncharacterized protein YaaN involved in tellurite resistance
MQSGDKGLENKQKSSNLTGVGGYLKIKNSVEDIPTIENKEIEQKNLEESEPTLEDKPRSIEEDIPPVEDKDIEQKNLEESEPTLEDKPKSIVEDIPPIEDREIEQENLEKIEPLLEDKPKSIEEDIPPVEDKDIEQKNLEKIEPLLEDKPLKLKSEKSSIKLYKDLDDVKQLKIDLLSEDIQNYNSIEMFGTVTQHQIHKVFKYILDEVKKDPADSILSAINTFNQDIKLFNTEELNPLKKQGYFSKLLGFITPATKFLNSADNIRNSSEKVESDLNKIDSTLFKNSTLLDKLHRVGTEFIGDLDCYIIAGAHKLDNLKDEALELKELTSTIKNRKKIKTINFLIEGLEKRVSTLNLYRSEISRLSDTINSIKNSNKSIAKNINLSLIPAIKTWRDETTKSIAKYRDEDLFDNENFIDTNQKLIDLLESSTKLANRLTSENLKIQYNLEDILINLKY